MLNLDFTHFGPEALTVAIRTANIHIGQELHFYVFKARAAARRAATIAAIKAKRTRCVAAFAGNRRLREQFANRIKRTDIARRVRARRLTNLRLIDHDDIGELFCTQNAIKGAGSLGRLAHNL